MILCCVLLSSCSILPQEESFPQAPMVKSSAKATFKTTQVQRGDMILEKKISCSYVPVQSQTLSYPISGLYYADTFVQLGDSVREGQLLAQLDLSDIEEKLAQCELQISKIGVRISALEENRALALERQRILHGSSTAVQLRQAQQQVNDSYDAQKRSLSDEMNIAQLQKEDYEQQIAARQLYAGISGIVTYVKQTEAGDKSTKAERFITVADTTSLFKAQTADWSLFEEGQEVTVVVSQREYAAVVVSEEQLGLERVQKTDGEKAYVYFRLNQPVFDLKEGSRGTVSIAVDSRENVLMLPERVVSSAGEQRIVYCPDENGMKTYKTVEIGLSADGMVEILSGLNEGDSVIVD